MEETYGSKFDSQLYKDVKLKTDMPKQPKPVQGTSAAEKVRDFVSENVSGLQGKISSMDISVNWKKILTVASVAGAIGGAAYLRRSRRSRAKGLASKARSMGTKAEKTMRHGAHQLAAKKKAATKSLSSLRN